MKNKLDRLETDQIFKDLLDSNRKLSRAGVNENSPYAVRNMPSHISITNMAGRPVSNFNQDMSGNLRLESKFTKIHTGLRQPTSVSGSSKIATEKSPTTTLEQNITSINRLSEANTVAGALSSNLAASIENNNSAIHKLENLIDDFSKPIE